eukprot:4960415-Ditylum_brightwellii.AAC.1
MPICRLHNKKTNKNLRGSLTTLTLTIIDIKTEKAISATVNRSTERKMINKDSNLLPSKEELYRLANELNDFSVEYHKVGLYDKALIGYKEAVRIRLVARKAERCKYSSKMEDFANLSRATVKEWYETLKMQKEELLLKTAGQQTPILLLDLYHERGSRTTCFRRNIVIVKPICSATQIIEEENKSKSVNSAVTLYNIGLIHQEGNNLIRASQLFSMALCILPQVSYPSLTAHILYSSAQILYQAGDFKRATHDICKSIQEYSRAAMSGTSHLGDSVELNLASTIALLGRIHFEEKNCHRAVELCQEVLRIRCSVLGDYHIHTAAASYNLALVLAGTGR